MTHTRAAGTAQNRNRSRDRAPEHPGRSLADRDMRYVYTYTGMIFAPLALVNGADPAATTGNSRAPEKGG